MVVLSCLWCSVFLVVVQVMDWDDELVQRHSSLVGVESIVLGGKVVEVVIIWLLSLKGI